MKQNMLYQYEKINIEGDLAALNILLGAKFGHRCNVRRKGKGCVTV